MYDSNPGSSALRFKKILGIIKASSQPQSTNAPLPEPVTTVPMANKIGLFKQDVFDLGSLLFLSALGGLEILDSSEFERIAARNSSSCCVLHCNEVKTPANPDSDQKARGLLLSQYFTNKRYSPEFLDFLCKSLRFSEEERSTVEDLQKHPWITGKVEFKSATVTLQELIQISNQWRQSVPPIEYQGPAEKQLDRVCEAMAAVLPCCENYEQITAAFANGKVEKAVAQELAVDLGLDLDKVWTRLLDIITTIHAQKEKPQ